MDSHLLFVLLLSDESAFISQVYDSCRRTLLYFNLTGYITVNRYDLLQGPVTECLLKHGLIAPGACSCLLILLFKGYTYFLAFVLNPSIAVKLLAEK